MQPVQSHCNQNSEHEEGGSCVRVRLRRTDPGSKVMIAPCRTCSASYTAACFGQRKPCHSSNARRNSKSHGQ
jgi:hypothetical protein